MATPVATFRCAANTADRHAVAPVPQQVNTISFPAGPHSIAASYNGDLSYNPSSANAVNFTIAPVPTSISVNASAASTIQDAVQITAQVSAPMPANAAFLPSGAVAFTDTASNSVLGPATYTSVGACKGVTTYCFAAYLQVNSTQLLAGDNSIIASYSGDTNFNASGNSAPATVTCNAS